MIRKLFIKAGLLAVIVFLLVELVIYFSPFKEKDEATDFAAAIIDKQAMLRRTKSPKIVFIGGSSVAYGIDTKLLQDSLKMPVLNMAFQYFMGSDFLFRQVADQMNEGDILVASFEYIMTDQGEIKEKMRVAEYFPEANDWFDYGDISEHISAWLRYKIDIFRRVILRLYSKKDFDPSVEDTTNVFFRKALNENGDLISHLNNPPIKIEECYTVKTESPFFNAVKNMEMHAAALKKRGVKVYFSYPPYEDNSYNRDLELFDQILPVMAKVKNVTLLDSPMALKYPDSLFQDMCYHLNAQGRRIRTLELLTNLKRLK